MPIIGVNDVNFFPEFVPMKKGDEKWEVDATHCHSCHQEFHPVLKRREHCTVCGYTFCKTCCHPQKVYNNHTACGGCVANAMMMVKERYDKKRTDQLKAHHEKYHHDEAEAGRARRESEPPAAAHKETDDLYGRAYEALLAESKKETPAAAPAAHAAVHTVGINEVNFFPDFKPVRKGDEKWETDKGTHCRECHNEFHPMAPADNCNVCGLVFCSRCCHSQRVYNNHRACGGCVAKAMIQIKTRYDKKRAEQLKAHHAKYHQAEAEASRAREAETAAKAHNEVDELYGRAYEALAAKMKDCTPASAAAVGVAGSSINQINFFPDFKPLASSDEKWETDKGTHCRECHQEFHVLTHRPTNCTVCGLVFCDHCCHSQQVYNQHVACGGCVTKAMMMIKERYDKKRSEQLKAHHAKHHADEAGRPRSHSTEDALKAINEHH